MKLLKVFATSLCLFLFTFTWASMPLHLVHTLHLSDTGKVEKAPIASTPDNDKDRVDHIRTKEEERYHLFKRPLLGIVAGFNFTSNNGSISTAIPPFLYNPEEGPVAGLSLIFHIGSALGIRLEVLYSQDAFADETQIGLETFIYYNRLSYIDVPLELQIRPFRKLTLFGGGDYQYLIRNTYQYVQSPVDPSIQETCQNHNVKNYFPGIVCGMSYMVYRIEVGGRVTFNVPNNYASLQQNAVLFQIALGYNFVSRR